MMSRTMITVLVLALLACTAQSEKPKRKTVNVNDPDVQKALSVSSLYELFLTNPTCSLCPNATVRP